MKSFTIMSFRRECETYEVIQQQFGKTLQTRNPKPYGSSHGASWCGANNCTNSKDKNPELTFHRFPSCPKRCKRWVDAVNRPDLLDKSTEYLSMNVKLCSRHFVRDSCYFRDSIRLRRDAVPTLFDAVDPRKKDKKDKKDTRKRPRPGKSEPGKKRIKAANPTKTLPAGKPPAEGRKRRRKKRRGVATAPGGPASTSPLKIADVESETGEPPTVTSQMLSRGSHNETSEQREDSETESRNDVFIKLECVEVCSEASDQPPASPSPSEAPRSRGTSPPPESPRSRGTSPPPESPRSQGDSPLPESPSVDATSPWRYTGENPTLENTAKKIGLAGKVYTKAPGNNNVSVQQMDQSGGEATAGRTEETSTQQPGTATPTSNHQQQPEQCSGKAGEGQQTPGRQPGSPDAPDIPSCFLQFDQYSPKAQRQETPQATRLPGASDAPGKPSHREGQGTQQSQSQSMQQPKPVHLVGLQRYLDKKASEKVHLEKQVASFKQQANRYRCKLRRQEKKIEELKKKAFHPEINARHVLEFTQRSLPLTIHNFIKVQLNCASRKSEGRRYSDEEFVNSLALWRQSPKAYDLLRARFFLPCPRQLRKVKVNTDVDTIIMPF